jgi:hypothetical protein
LIDEREQGSEVAAAVTVVRVRATSRNGNGVAHAPEAPPSPDAPASPGAVASSDAPAAKATGVEDRRPARAAKVHRDDPTDFPVHLVRSMQAAARAHRERAEEQIELRRVAVLAAIRDERRAEAIRARQATAQNRRAVDAWAATAQRQIKTERQRRKVELDAELRRTLREQNRQLDRRVKDIEDALAAHRAELDAFFEAIETERDPVEIARKARSRPAFPDLDKPVPAPPDLPSPTD